MITDVSVTRVVFQPTKDTPIKSSLLILRPGFHKANFDHDNDQFWVKTKRLVGRMTAQPNDRFVLCVVVVDFAANGNQALRMQKTMR